jgi:hypothetical protein
MLALWDEVRKRMMKTVGDFDPRLVTKGMPLAGSVFVSVRTANRVVARREQSSSCLAPDPFDHSALLVGAIKLQREALHVQGLHAGGEGGGGQL